MLYNNVNSLFYYNLANLFIIITVQTAVAFTGKHTDKNNFPSLEILLIIIQLYILNFPFKRIIFSLINILKNFI